jgi:leukotriene-A4 hydrolase
MKDYVKTFTNTSITTQQWRDHLFDYFGRQPNGADYLKKLEQVNWDEVRELLQHQLCRAH